MEQCLSEDPMRDSEPSRFVILHHTGYGDSHWDLMFEEQESLATWRLYRDPLQLGTDEAQLFRIGDHRKAYLDYEGPVSGGRGHVRRMIDGTYAVLDKNSQLWRVVLHAPELSGPFRLEVVECEIWRIQATGPSVLSR